MAVDDPQTLDKIFSALSSPLRRDILARLAAGEATVTEIAGPFNTSLNAVSKHLKVLEAAGLIRREVKGREHYCFLNPEPLDDVARWAAHYRQFWRARLDAMEAQLRER